jgi:glycosyltransferase involved in cell wall biosynthesis
MTGPDQRTENIITPQVAIIVIAFNEERRIGECLRALLAQDTPLSFEVVVVDDGSQDSTVKVIESFLVDHSNIRLIRHSINRGRGSARRSGQESAQSQFIGFVDADIVVPPDWLRRCLSELSTFDAVSGIALPDGDCAVIWRICEPKLRRRPGSAEITGNNVLFSREALTRVPFARESKLGEDFRLAKLMMRSGLRLTTVRDLVVEHRESKTYMDGVKWMWRSGVDATALLIDFRVVRLPDLAWITWTVGTLTLFLIAAVSVIDIWVAIAAVIALTVLICILFIQSRFLFRPRTLRFFFAITVSPPLILAYLIGRCAGLVRIFGLLRHGTLNSGSQ